MLKLLRRKTKERPVSYWAEADADLALEDCLRRLAAEAEDHAAELAERRAQGEDV
jgi:hypothetical protein